MNEHMDVSVLTAGYTDKKSVNDDYRSIIKLHFIVSQMDTFDIAIIHKDADANIRIISKLEESAGQSAWTGALSGLAFALLIIFFPGIELIGGLFDATFIGSIVLIAMVAVSTVIGSILGTYVGHMKKGMSNKNLKNLGKALEADRYALVVIASTDASDGIQAAMKSAQQIDKKDFTIHKKALQQEIKKALAPSTFRGALQCH